MFHRIKVKLIVCFLFFNKVCTHDDKNKISSSCGLRRPGRGDAGATAGHPPALCGNPTVQGLHRISGSLSGPKSNFRDGPVPGPLSRIGPGGSVSGVLHCPCSVATLSFLSSSSMGP